MSDITGETRQPRDGEFPVEVVISDTPHKVAVEWDWHDMAGAVTPPNAGLVITVTLLDDCARAVLPIEWCVTHRDVVDLGEDSCGYSAHHPGRCVLVPCYVEEARDVR